MTRVSLPPHGHALLHCADGRRLSARRVVVSAPLALLQRGAIEFEPPLPPEHLEAIAAVKIGNGLKVRGSKEGVSDLDETSYALIPTVAVHSPLLSFPITRRILDAIGETSAPAPSPVFALHPPHTCSSMRTHRESPFPPPPLTQGARRSTPRPHVRSEALPVPHPPVGPLPSTTPTAHLLLQLSLPPSPPFPPLPPPSGVAAALAPLLAR